MFKISEVDIKPVTQQKSLIAFCSLTIDDSLRLNNLAIHTRRDLGIRIVYPKSHQQATQNFYPITKQTGKYLEDTIYRQCILEGVLDGRHYKN